MIEFAPQQKFLGLRGARMPVVLTHAGGEANDDLYQQVPISLLRRTNF
jgi:hypothetical protein